MMLITDTPLPRRGAAVGVQTLDMTMRFGSFTALDHVSIDIPAAPFTRCSEKTVPASRRWSNDHGILSPDLRLAFGRRSRGVDRFAQDAATYGLGMVYQQFTLVPSLTGAENLVISRTEVPAVINWAKERKALATFMERMPFQIPLDRPVSHLAAGEKQKLEIVKQLYLAAASSCSTNRLRC